MKNENFVINYDLCNVRTETESFYYINNKTM